MGWAVRRKPREVRWAFGRMIPSIAELKARERTHYVEHSRSVKHIQKRSQKAPAQRTSSLAQQMRPLHIQRAGSSSGERLSMVTISATGESCDAFRLISKTLACNAHRPIYINQPPSPYPRFSQEQEPRLCGPRRRARPRRRFRHGYRHYTGHSCP